MFRTPTTRGRAVRLGVAAAVATSASIVLLQGVSTAAAGTYIATPATGPVASTTWVTTLAGTGFADAAGTPRVNTGSVVFATTCSTTPGLTVTAGGLTATLASVVSATRLAVTTPSLAIVSTTAASAAFKVCVFDKTTPFSLLGSAVYTVYKVPTVTKVAPAAGPSYGGNTVTVVGVNLSTKSTATVGGLPLTNIKVTGTTSLTGTVPAHAATLAALDVVVSTEAGPSVITATYLGTVNDYDYRNAISVSPSVGTSGTVISIKGSGFKALDLVTTTHTAVVYFVDGAYDPTDDGTTAKTVPQVARDRSNALIPALPAPSVAGDGAQCLDIQVLSDTELACTAPDLVGKSYTITVVNDITVGANSLNASYLQTVVSSGSTFTYASF
jgi:IPT/TIG domain